MVRSIKQYRLPRGGGNTLIPHESSFEQLLRELRAFLEQKPESITNARRLAQIMGGKAARIRDNVTTYLQIENSKNEELLRIYKVMKELLVHDLEIGKFADMYAQTLVYGLFVARYYDRSPNNFSRQEARDLIPASNSFLQHFFDHIAGVNFDRRLTYIVDELCEVFQVSDVRMIIQKHYNLFGEVTEKDPIIHFYEDFLEEYDPQLRKSMGAYYTPLPVVDFIVRAIDDVLRNEFGLYDGLTSTEKIHHEIQIQGKRKKIELHRVQILDPAVGTATFLNETVKFIYKKFNGQEGLWKSYVKQELLPRLHGFELMMAPYTIAHLKLVMTLKETGIDQLERRLGVYLTNTLEEGVEVNSDMFSFGFAEAISEEAKSASIIKHERPIMVILGNPPYSGESFNKGNHAMKLVNKYKFEPGGKEKLKERNPKWINDDYVKFIAFAEEVISKTGEGVVSMITNHSYIDNPTFRGMRWHLAKTFSTIYILDLHGNTKKKEVAPDGGKDENVFRIQQGVSIIIAFKHKQKTKKLADIYKADLFGRKQSKFDFLLKSSIKSIQWEHIPPREPSYLFLQGNEKLEKEYYEGIKVNELFPTNGVGVTTAHDSLVINEDEEELIDKAYLFGHFKGTNLELCNKLQIREKPGWNITAARDALSIEENLEQYLVSISYRPFDTRKCFYHDKVVWRRVYKIMQHFLHNDNLGLVLCRQQKAEGFYHAFVHENIVESSYVSNRTSEIGSSFPLYLYGVTDRSLFESKKTRQANLNLVLVKKLLSRIGTYKFLSDHIEKKSDSQEEVTPLDIFDYVYAILHSHSYRLKFKNLLKKDFPCIPVVKNKQTFWFLVEKGKLLRNLHLLKNLNPVGKEYPFPVSGNNMVELTDFRDGKLFINDVQYFDNLSREVLNFQIGGYQPAQKWLKDRRGKDLSYKEITHYQKILFSLSETIRIMNEIDSVVLE